MKKIYSGILCLMLIFSIGALAEAHPGRTDANGGHTCRTNCEKWGLEYGEYHYHNGGKSSGSSSNTSSSSSSSSTSSAKSVAPAPVESTPQYELANVTVKINEKTLSFSQEPVSVENNTMVPMREIFEALGAAIKWESSTETVTATKGDLSIKLIIGQSYALKNDERISLSPPAMIVNDKTMVPLRFVSESLGASVKWNESTRTVDITM